MNCSFSKEFSKTAYTTVENSFITEYMPNAGENAVRVYLYGLFLCNHPEKNQTLEEIATLLGLETNVVIDCFYYWEEFGLVSVLSTSPLNVQYLPLSGLSSSKPRKFKAEKYGDFAKGLQILLPSRMISTSEYTEYFTIMETYGIKPEAMLLIVKYCVDRKGNDISHKYISKVAKDFGNRDLNTVEKVEKELSSYVPRTGEIAKILKAMNVKRQPDIDDLNLYKKWTQELHFETENIIFAATKMKKSNVNKLDEFLIKLYNSKCFSKEEISEYIANKEELYNATVKINRALAVYVDVLDTEIDTYISKWFSYGFTTETLTYVASKLFLDGKNTLNAMDEFIEYLRTRGFIDLSSVNDYFEQLKKADEFIKQVLVTAGLNRRPTPWDRENLTMWKSWNFTEDMILEASKLASGKTSPVQYINGILSNWKNKGIFTVDQIEGKTTSLGENSQEAYNREYEKRRSNAVSRAQKNTEKAMSVDGVSQVLSRLSSIEKDLAFAEIANNQEALINLEEEKKNLFIKANSLLKTVGLKYRDLFPVYACSKCNDTGYVGTKRCDCYKKNNEEK